MIMGLRDYMLSPLSCCLPLAHDGLVVGCVVPLRVCYVFWNEEPSAPAPWSCGLVWGCLLCLSWGLTTWPVDADALRASLSLELV